MNTQQSRLEDLRPARSESEWDGLVQPGRVHRRVYTDQQIFSREMRNVYAATWVFLLHESEIPNPNDFRQLRLGRRPVLVTRGKDGDIAVLLNRCPHRGATVCREPHGNASTFTCPYHGWKFRNSGRLFTVPGKDAYGGRFDRDSLSMGRVPRVETYRGFVFATMNMSAPSLMEHLGPARHYMDQWLDQGGDIVVSPSAHRFHMRCNWKLAYDNAGDGYHVPFSHQSLLQMTTQRYGGGDMEYFGSADGAAMRAYALGNGHTLIDQRSEMYRDSAWRQQRLQPGREPFEEAVRRTVEPGRVEAFLAMGVGSGMNLNIFPNLLLIGNQIQVIEPVSASETVLHWHATLLSGVKPKALEEALNAIRMRTQEDFPVLGEVDDAANFEACQKGLEEVPEMEWVDISRHLDTGVDAQGDDGSTSTAVTSELHARSYFQHWKRLMAAEPVLTVSVGGRHEQC